MKNREQNDAAKAITDQPKVTSVSKKLDRIIGIAKLPSDFDDKKELTDYFEKKHLLNN